MIPPMNGPKTVPTVKAIETYPMAAPTWSLPTVSTTSAMPTVHTTAADRPCRARAITSDDNDLANQNTTVVPPRANRPIMNGSWRDELLSAKYPKMACESSLVRSYSPSIPNGAARKLSLTRTKENPAPESSKHDRHPLLYCEALCQWAFVCQYRHRKTYGHYPAQRLAFSRQSVIWARSSK